MQLGLLLGFLPLLGFLLLLFRLPSLDAPPPGWSLAVGARLIRVTQPSWDSPISSGPPKPQKTSMHHQTS